MPRARPSGTTILIAAYAALVLSVLAITPLWLDELWGGGRDASVVSLVQWVQINPGGVPLSYLMQKEVSDLFGPSAFVLRLPAALCSIAAALVFAGLSKRLGIRSSVWATAVFLALPLQFRYALEARGYSLGLLCTLVSLWLLLRARERGTAAAAAWYGASVALGLYSLPLTILPVFGELLWLIGERDVSSRTKRMVLGGAAGGALLFAPWYLLQREVQERFATMSYYSFSWRQVTPLTFLHELSGGGYVCTVALLLCAMLAWAPGVKLRYRRLLGSVALAALIGPIVVDFLVQYFFAARQLLFAIPALTLCAGCGIDWLRQRPWARLAVLLPFFIGAAVADYRLATVPKDSLGAQAGILAAHLSGGGCIAVAPPNHMMYYVFLRPELEGHVCAEPPAAPRVYGVMSPYSTAAQRAQLSDVLSTAYNKIGELQAGAGEIGVYDRR